MPVRPSNVLMRRVHGAPSLLLALLLAVSAWGHAAAADDEVPSIPLPSESVGEAELRAQLQQVRALNATLRAEREVLERQLAALQAQIDSGNRRLGEAALVEEQRDSRLGFLALVAVVVAAAGAVFARRRRAA